MSIRIVFVSCSLTIGGFKKWVSFGNRCFFDEYLLEQMAKLSEFRGWSGTLKEHTQTAPFGKLRAGSISYRNQKMFFEKWKERSILFSMNLNLWEKVWICGIFQPKMGLHQRCYARAGPFRVVLQERSHLSQARRNRHRTCIRIHSETNGSVLLVLRIVEFLTP